MSTKAAELRNPSSCLNRARPDEFLFVLRSNDPLAPQVVRLWSAMAEGIHEPGKIDEARVLADMMEKQRHEREPKCAEAPKALRQGEVLGASRASAGAARDVPQGGMTRY